MTAAQRRSVTVKIGGEGHQVEITAEVQDPSEVVKLAEVTYHSTRPAPRPGVGFASQLSHTTPDREVAGNPLYTYGGPVEAKGR